jgi:hypothetical protein
MNSMQIFNPDAECLVHDRLTNELIAWKTEWAAHYREFAKEFDEPGLVSWDGLLLDGWMPHRPR